MPLTSKWWLSKKKGKEAWVEPIVDHQHNSYELTVRTGTPTTKEAKTISAGTKTGRGANFLCLLCGQAANEQHIKSEAKKGQMGVKLLAVVAEGKSGRIYFSATLKQERAPTQAQPDWIPTQPLAYDPRNIWCVGYGLDNFSKLFTLRQLVALTTFSNLVQEAREKVLADAQQARFPVDGISLNDVGTGANAYADAVATYLTIAVDRLADRNSTICSWDVSRDSTRNTFARQAIPMTWDFAEANPFSDSTGNFQGAVDWVAEVIEASSYNAPGEAKQCDATTAINGVAHPLISTDPPYYDNIGYADLSDFFYIWLRRSLHAVYPDLFRTMLVPKAQELVATPYWFEG